jgi:hypothetical protein
VGDVTKDTYNPARPAVCGMWVGTFLSTVLRDHDRPLANKK